MILHPLLVNGRICFEKGKFCAVISDLYKLILQLIFNIRRHEELRCRLEMYEFLRGVYKAVWDFCGDKISTELTHSDLLPAFRISIHLCNVLSKDFIFMTSKQQSNSMRWIIIQSIFELPISKVVIDTSVFHNNKLR